MVAHTSFVRHSHSLTCWGTGGGLVGDPYVLRLTGIDPPLLQGRRLLPPRHDGKKAKQKEEKKERKKGPHANLFTEN